MAREITIHRAESSRRLELAWILSRLVRTFYAIPVYLKLLI